MSIYSYKLPHVQVVINCRYSIAHLCTSEAMLAHKLGALHFDDPMSYNSLTFICFMLNTQYFTEFIYLIYIGSYGFFGPLVFYLFGGMV